jgi:glycosyltransferase involved in cell wall biosynthesis
MASSSESRPVIALVAWRALPAVLPELGSGIGGIETGAWTLARGLAADGRMQPRLVVADRPQPYAKRVSGVEIEVHPALWLDTVRQQVAQCITLQRQPRWRMRVKQFSPHLLWQVPLLAGIWPFRTTPAGATDPDHRLVGSKADIWCAFGVSASSARVIAAARAALRDSLLFLESNADLDARWLNDSGYVNPYGETPAAAQYCLKQATAIVCQSHWQQQHLAERFSRTGELIHNPIDVAEWQTAAKQPGDYVLWVGRWDKFHKRPARMIEIARQCPDMPFVMIANPHDKQAEAELRDTVPSNVRLVDYIPFARMPEVFGQSRVFLSTSSAEFEGFPNVLLQAAAAGKPIVSQEDFDDFVTRSGAGRVVGPSIEAAVAALREVWSTPALPASVREYLLTHHSSQSIADQVVNLSFRLLGRPFILPGQDP